MPNSGYHHHHQNLITFFLIEKMRNLLIDWSFFPNEFNFFFQMNLIFLQINWTFVFKSNIS